MTRLTSIVVASLTLLTVPVGATEDEEREAAKVAFEEGTRLFESNDFAAALERFNAAQAIRPHDKVRIPIATCLERLARFREAIGQWEAVAESEQVDAAQQEEATNAIARLTPRLARLTVEGAPKGTEVLVDDELFCTLPCEPAFDPGQHVITLRTPEDEQTQRVRVERGERHRVTWRSEAPEASMLPVTPPTSGVTTSAEPAATEGTGPTPLTWIGVGLAGVGVAGIVGFGLHADATHDDYLAAPSEDTRSQGLLARNLSNASIAVAGVGALLVVVDLVFLATWSDETDVGLEPTGVTLRF